MIRQTQSGLVLLAMLVLLVGVGSGWVSIAATHKHAGIAHVGLSYDDRQSLIDTRQSLLSYAAMYPLFYGPSGAGPAHLPCPDTDGFRGDSTRVESGVSQRRDGPNPPCSSYLVSEGLMPRHVKLPGLRYAFHSQSRQRFYYEVAGSLVNNPLNRIVNLNTLNDDDFAPGAIVTLPSADDHATVARVMLSKEALIVASAAAVAAWIIQKSREQKLCDATASKKTALVPGVASATQTPCIQPQRLLSKCKSEHLLVLLLDSPLISDTCLAQRLEDQVMDGVPAKRHWFVRNLWHTSVVFVYGEGCDPASMEASDCSLRYPLESRRAIASGGVSIELLWSMSI